MGKAKILAERSEKNAAVGRPAAVNLIRFADTHASGWRAVVRAGP